MRVGLSGCDIGVSWLLPRLVGVGAAHELMLTGRTIDATEAHRIGLVVDVVDDADLTARVSAEVDLLLANAPFGVEMTKETMWASLEIGALDAAIDLENRTQVMCMAAGDFDEAVAAFLDKRDPRWLTELRAPTPPGGGPG